MDDFDQGGFKHQVHDNFVSTSQVKAGKTLNLLCVI